MVACDVILPTRPQPDDPAKADHIDRPDHAWVIYELHAPDDTVLTTSRGEAVLVDDVWKVTRETICADIQKTGARCPDPVADPPGQPDATVS
jgi:hypothetical protein